jgi:hypothetical protein
MYARIGTQDEAWLRVLPLVLGLRELALLTMLTPVAAWAGLASATTLQSLSLFECPTLTDQTLAVLGGGLPSLKALCLDQCTGVSTLGLERFAARRAPPATPLRHLQLRLCPRVTSVPPTMRVGLETLELDLQWEAVAAHFVVPEVAQAHAVVPAGPWPCLRQLVLPRLQMSSSIDPRYAHTPPRSLPFCGLSLPPSVTSLRLRGGHLVGQPTTASPRLQLQTLERLDLTGSDLRDNDLKTVLGPALGGPASSLRFLCLGSCRITMDGLHGLGVLARLEGLETGLTPVQALSDSDDPACVLVDSLVAYLHTLPQLAFLVLSGGRSDSEAKRTLAERLMHTVRVRLSFDEPDPTWPAFFEPLPWA